MTASFKLTLQPGIKSQNTHQTTPKRLCHPPEMQSNTFDLIFTYPFKLNISNLGEFMPVVLISIQINRNYVSSTTSNIRDNQTTPSSQMGKEPITTITERRQVIVRYLSQKISQYEFTVNNSAHTTSIPKVRGSIPPSLNFPISTSNSNLHHPIRNTNSRLQSQRLPFHVYKHSVY